MKKVMRVLLLVVVASPGWLVAGGPLVVGGPAVGGRPAFGVDGRPITWSPARMPIQYRVDPGPLAQNASGGTVVDNAAALTRLQAMFAVWQGVSTARVSFAKAGNISNTGAYTGGDVKTVQQFNAIAGACDSGAQSPVVFDANGSLLSDLGLPPEVIGFASICAIDTANGHIASALILMNGKMQDGASTSSNYELTANQFDEAITHEVGHFLGLDHSQINVDLLTSNAYPCNVEGLRGLPLMFPIEACQARKDAGVPMLAPDDVAWISTLYPSSTFAANYATVSGTIYFEDGLSAMQGINVIARRVDDPATQVNEERTVAVSSVSGLLFTNNPGQDVTALLPDPSQNNAGGSPAGSRNPALIGYYKFHLPPGTYTIEVEGVFQGFTGGSSVGPMDPPVSIGAGREFWNEDESARDFTLQRDWLTVAPGQTIEGIDIILNSSPQRFDSNEDEGARLAPMAPLTAAAEVQA